MMGIDSTEKVGHATQSPMSNHIKAPKGILKLHRAAAGDTKSQRSVLSGNSYMYQNAPTGAKPNQRASLEPTYKLQPDENRQFNAEQIEKILKDTLEAHLSKSTYDPEHCSRLAHNLCSVIKARIKQEGLDRYRIIAQVIIGQDTEQGIQLASRCLWNPQTDNFAATTFRNNSLYAIALVYGLYLD